MSPDTYKAALDAAKEELAALIGEQGENQQRLQEIEQRLGDLRQSIAALSKLAGEEFDEEETLGLTDMIRLVIQEAGRPVSTQEVRVMLESRGFNTRRYGNLMASIITVLKRLQEKHQVREDGTIGGKPAYRWGAAPIIRSATSYRSNQLGRTRPNLPVSDSEHPIHNPEPIAKVEEWKPKYGTPDPLNRHGKK